MSRKQRKEIWPLFDDYRDRLERLGLKEPEDAMRDAASLIEMGKLKVRYSSVIVDEAQDMSTNAFALLRRVVPESANDMFIVGDGHQRIYRRKVVLSRAGINIRGRRSRYLRINYRTTEEIRRFAVAVLHGLVADDLDGGQDRQTNRRYKSLLHGQRPTIRVFDTMDQEVEAVAQWIGPPEQAATSGTCVVARTKKLRDAYERQLNARGLATYRIKRSEPEDTSKPGVRMATMHRVKGLEFTRIVLVGMSEDNMPWKKVVARSEDPAVREDLIARERALLYVAVTRARNDALITAHGKLSGWLDGLVSR